MLAASPAISTSFPLDADRQRTARLAGLFYVGTIAAGLFAEIGGRGAVRDGDGARMMAALADHQALYRAGAVADLAMLGCYVAVTALLYALLAPRARDISLVAAFLSLIGIAVLAANLLFHLLPLNLMAGAGHDGLPLALRQELVDIALDMHGQLYGVSLVFFGAYCVLVGFAAARDGLVPWAVGALMMIGGGWHLLADTLAIGSPELAAGLPRWMNLSPLIGEAAFGGWLLVFGAGKRAGAPG
ncbi:DUF4386 domain-containing protein [Sphingobium xenophagum]|uniref:DUF4386 domain-containing protein n=1 Tax=Sphingobium xenophagum TaxID=121428 RepID=A0A401J8K4_SPHXE|nr:DUF4386 domain-containing protein [Sphingobium xenophagum]GBH32967.1 hypothetical protein MBESOW_P4193 [Sphingobium xenophagum]